MNFASKKNTSIYRLIYSFVLYLSAPVIFLRLWRKGKKLPAYRERWGERLALFSALPEEPRIWLHAVSVGEVNAAAALIENLLTKTNHKILVTTTTPTGSSLLQSRFEDRVEHVYFPYDFPRVIKRFLRKIKPSICVVMETELWPNCFYYCQQHKVPVVIVNARLSEKSVLRYQKLSALTRSTLQSTQKIFAQGRADAERFVKLGAQTSSVTVIGNLKFDIQLPSEVRQQGAELRNQWPDYHFIWIAASTHADEEARLINVHKELLAAIDKSLLVIVPRHPDRFNEVADICVKSGLKFTTRSSAGLLKEDTRVYLADTLGELNILYGAVDAAFVAGSFADIGGHNPLESAAHGIPVITGPVMHNFAEIYHNMFEQNAAQKVNNEKDLLSFLIKLSTDTRYRQASGQAANAFLEENSGGLDVVSEYIIHAIQKHTPPRS